MLKPLTKFIFVLCCLIAISACNQKAEIADIENTSKTENSPLGATEKNGPVLSKRASILVDSDWLTTRIKSDNIRILELGRNLDEYAQGHVPGAVFVDWRLDISDQSQPEMYSVLQQRDFEALMSKLGIKKDTGVVVYDTLNNRASTRMYWMLKYYNHAEVYILDGGLDAWLRSGQTLSNQPPTPPVKSEYSVDIIQHQLLADKTYIETNLANDNMKLVDGRPFDQYTGEAEGKVYNTGIAHQRGGHIYGAKTVPWADNLNDDGTFKSSQELQAIYEQHDIFNQGVVVTYCNEGLHAAMPWFVLQELLGYQDVRLYDNSMAEWANIFDTPMKTGEHCM